MSYLPYLCLLAYSGVQHILCFCFVLYFFVLCTLCCQFLCFSSYFVPYVASFSVFLRIVYSMLQVSLFFFVLCTLCCQFLCFSSYCVPNVASFSVFLRIVYSMLPVSLFFFVLCTLCCQFLCFHLPIFDCPFDIFKRLFKINASDIQSVKLFLFIGI